jgi:hypothetical protein
MSNKIMKHPSLQFFDLLKEICKPLEDIGIDYFSQVRIDKNNNFSSLIRNPKYHTHYLSHHYYNCCIHLVDPKALGDMIVWDLVKTSGNSEQMVRDAAACGASHLFTLVKRNADFCDYFHFATSHADDSINQFYISQRNYLETFILYFLDKVKTAKELSSAWNIKFDIECNQAQFEISQSNMARQLNANLADNCNYIYVTHDQKHFFITAREYTMLQWLSFGKTAEEIAIICRISASTVRKHIEHIKEKSSCYTLFQLGELYAHIKTLVTSQ